jgi:Fe-S-cluster containining protein
VTPPPRRVRALSIHAGYRCRHAGACCSSGWDIPVEPGVEERLRASLRSGALRVPDGRPAPTPPGSEPGREATCFRSVDGLPHGARVVLEADSAGRCVFLEADGRCAVHRHLGLEALPPACRDFPRMATLTPLGASITLSHYCPTAASLLFAPVILRDSALPGPEGSAVSIVESPPAFPSSWPHEGLDARDALPPLLRPGVLMDWPSLERWERFAVAVLGDEGRSPEAALDLLAATAEEVRRWSPEDGPFGGFFESVLSSRGTSSESGPEGSTGAGGSFGTGQTEVPQDDRSRSARPESLGVAWRLVADCVPHRELLPPAPEGLDDADRRWVAPSWATLARPVRRWLAAKAFASWLALQGEGLRTTALGLRVALGALRAEAARGCAEAGRALDADLLKEAVRRADRLLVHLADPEALARRLSRGESAGGEGLPRPCWSSRMTN